MEHMIKCILFMAVKREVEAHEFYKKVSERSADKEVKKVFAQLAKEELGHKEFLEKFSLDPSLDMKIEAPAKDYKVSEATELPELSIDMKPADAIALAMKKEQQAVEFYREMSGHTRDPEIKKVFDNLANMELNHKHWLENVFVEIGYPEVF